MTHKWVFEPQHLDANANVYPTSESEKSDSPTLRPNRQQRRRRSIGATLRRLSWLSKRTVRHNVRIERRVCVFNDVHLRR